MEWILMGHSLKTEAGASIVEICITLVIITVTTALIMSFSRSTYRMSSDARAKDSAIFVAEQKIADLSKSAFSTLPAESATPETVPVDNITFTRTWKVVQSGNLLCATVTVSWFNNSRNITLTGAVN
jgi:hypothetical protein